MLVKLQIELKGLANRPYFSRGASDANLKLDYVFISSHPVTSDNAIRYLSLVGTIPAARLIGG